MTVLFFPIPVGKLGRQCVARAPIAQRVAREVVWVYQFSLLLGAVPLLEVAVAHGRVAVGVVGCRNRKFDSEAQLPRREI